MDISISSKLTPSNQRKSVGGGGGGGVGSPALWKNVQGEAPQPNLGVELHVNHRIDNPILPSVRMIPRNVFTKPCCLPVSECTWILDFTQSMGNTVNHRQAPAKPPLNTTGRLPAWDQITRMSFTTITWQNASWYITGKPYNRTYSVFVRAHVLRKRRATEFIRPEEAEVTR